MYTTFLMFVTRHVAHRVGLLIPFGSQNKQRNISLTSLAFIYNRETVCFLRKRDQLFNNKIECQQMSQVVKYNTLCKGPNFQQLTLVGLDD
jgi:hypothetical protein